MSNAKQLIWMRYDFVLVVEVYCTAYLLSISFSFLCVVVPTRALGGACEKFDFLVCRVMLSMLRFRYVYDSAK